MEHEWKVGELAVCVSKTGIFVDELVVGRIYPIRKIFKRGQVKPNGRRAIAICLDLLGLPSASPDPMIWGWNPVNFRPLNEDDYKRIREKHSLNDKASTLVFALVIGVTTPRIPENNSPIDWSKS